MVFAKVFFNADESVALEADVANAFVFAGTVGAFSICVAYVDETFVDVFTFAVHIFFVAIVTNTFKAAGRVVAVGEGAAGVLFLALVDVFAEAGLGGSGVSVGAIAGIAAWSVGALFVVDTFEVVIFAFIVVLAAVDTVARETFFAFAFVAADGVEAVGVGMAFVVVGVGTFVKVFAFACAVFFLFVATDVAFVAVALVGADCVCTSGHFVALMNFKCTLVTVFAVASVTFVPVVAFAVVAEGVINTFGVVVAVVEFENAFV